MRSIIMWLPRSLFLLLLLLLLLLFIVFLLLFQCAVIKSNFKDQIVINGDGKGDWHYSEYTQAVSIVLIYAHVIVSIIGHVIGLTMLPATSVLDDDTDCSLLKVQPYCV